MTNYKGLTYREKCYILIEIFLVNKNREDKSLFKIQKKTESIAIFLQFKFMKMGKNSNTDIILKSLIIAVLQRKPEVFWYHMCNSRAVETDFPNKYKFYMFFKDMLSSSYCKTKGQLHLVIEKPEWETEGFQQYSFYDSFHKHARFYVRIKRGQNNSLCFDMMPF